MIQKRLNFLFLVFFGSFAGSLLAQSSDGHVAVEKSGFALVKPQPWSSPSQASPLKFTAYTDRSARGTPGAGYFVFRVPNQNDRQIPVAQIVKVVPQPEVPNNISTQAECDLIKKAVADFRDLSKAYPIAKTFIDEMINPLSSDVAKYESGQIKIDGDWKTKIEVSYQDKTACETKLKKEFFGAKNPARFDMESNLYYIKLLEFSKGDPELSKRLAALKLEHQRLRAQDENKEVLSKLNDATLSPNDVDLVIKRLKALPNPDVGIRSILNQAKQAEVIESQVKELRAIIEAKFDSLQSPVPGWSLDDRNKVQKLSQEFDEFKSSAPPAAIHVPIVTIKAIILFDQRLDGIVSAVQEHKYLEVNTTIATLVDPSSKIGVHTQQWVAWLLTFTTTQVAAFTKYRTAAVTLQKEGKYEAALAKYQEALAVMPSPEVSAEMRLISTTQLPKKK